MIALLALLVPLVALFILFKLHGGHISFGRFVPVNFRRPEVMVAVLGVAAIIAAIVIVWRR